MSFLQSVRIVACAGGIADVTEGLKAQDRVIGQIGLYVIEHSVVSDRVATDSNMSRRLVPQRTDARGSLI